MQPKQSTTDIAYRRLRDLEGKRRDFHFDGKGVLTLGSGYTPIIYNGSTWQIHPNLDAQLESADIKLSRGEKAAIRRVETQMGKSGGLTPMELQQARAALSELRITDTQNAALIRPLIEAAERDVTRHLGDRAADQLNAHQLAELTVGAYQSPAAFAKAATKIRSHAEIGDFQGVASRFEEIGIQLGDRERYRSGAQIIRNPSGDGTTIIRSGETLGQVALKHGVSVDALMKANSNLQNPDRIRAGTVIRLPDGASASNNMAPDLDELRIQSPHLPGGDADRELDDRIRQTNQNATGGPVPDVRAAAGTSPDRGAVPGKTPGGEAPDAETGPGGEPAPAGGDEPRRDRGEDPETGLPPDARDLRDRLRPSAADEEDVDTLLLKSAEVLTPAEERILADAYFTLPANDPRRAGIDAHRRGYFEAAYGTGPAATDETGRPVPAAPNRPLPKRPSPVTTARGGTLEAALTRVADSLGRAAASNGAEPVARALQTGLGLLAGTPLKIDGDVGPKTKGALARTVVRHGPGAADEAVAIGRVRQALGGADRAPGPGAVKAAVTAHVQPLLDPTGRNPVAAKALQETVNELGPAEGRDAPAPAKGSDARTFQPLAVDGDIGPKTEAGVATALARTGPDDFAKSYARNLGFFA